MTAQSNAALKEVACYEGAIEGEIPPLVEEGIYSLVFDHHRTRYLFGRAAKLYCYFKITDPGPFNGVRLVRYYNVKSLQSRPRKGGAFNVGFHSDFVREYVMLCGMPERLDRMSTRQFKNFIAKGRVVTVREDAKRRPIPEGLRYSVIAEIIGRET